MKSTMRRSTRWILPLALILSVASAQLAIAEDKPTGLSDARAAVEVNLRTAEGKKYDEQMGNEFAQRHVGALRQCKQNGAPLENFWILMKLDKDGTPKELLLHPEARLGVCAREGLLKEKFLPPPRSGYWVSVYLQLSH